MKYVLLLRGINVGKSIKISMKDLKGILENLQLKNVVTYLNSGNVIFDSDENEIELTEMISKSIQNKYKEQIPILVKKSADIIEIANSIPIDWTNDQTQQTYVAYLFDQVANELIIDELPIKRQYVELLYVNKAVIWNIKRDFYNKSQITKLATHSSYEYMTTRNVNTARKLAELCK